MYLGSVLYNQGNTVATASELSHLIQESSEYYYTSDHIGNVRELMNGSGTIVARYSYDPYGVATLVSGSNLATRQYAGLFYHPASGLDLGTYRLYKPTTGTFLNRDPLGENGGLNAYDYVGNDPIDWTDPDALKKCYRWFLITFYSTQKDPKGRNSWNKGGLNDNSAATGLTNYSQDPNSGRAARTGPSHGKDSYAYPPGTQVTIHRGTSGTDNRTVQDGGGGFADPRPGAPGGVNPYEWFDLFDDNARRAAKLGIEVDLVETTVPDNCKCSTGWSENPNTPVPPELQKIIDAVNKQ
jgi:RHS repeat-associated protein